MRKIHRIRRELGLPALLSYLASCGLVVSAVTLVALEENLAGLICSMASVVTLIPAVLTALAYDREDDSDER